MSKINFLQKIVENGEMDQVVAAVQVCLTEKIPPIDILNIGMIEAMTLVGQKFQHNEIFVPEMLLAAKTMKKGVEILKPYLCSKSGLTTGKMVMGTVHGDLHDIGKNLVIMMVEATGYEVIDLGIDVPVQRFVDAASDPAVTLVGVSALLTTTLPAMQETVAALNASPRREAFKIMVGGASVTREFAREIGADIYTTDAVSAGLVAKELEADGDFDSFQNNNVIIKTGKERILK